MQIPLTGGQSKSRSKNFNLTLRRNCFSEVSESENSKTPTALVGTPGLKLFTTVTPTSGSTGRGMYVTASERLFTVVGSTLAEIDNNGVVTNRGELNTNNGPIHMVDNGLELIVVDGTNGYLLTLATNIFLEINLTNFPASEGFPDDATHVVFMDQYFIANQANTNKFFISGLSDGGTWIADDFGTAEYAPDHIQSMETLRSNIWTFCDDTIEVFYNSGAATFPFKRVQGAVQEFGTLAKNSTAKMNNSVFWLGSNKDGNRVVFKSNGYNAVRISTHDIEAELAEMSELSDAVGFTYQQEGHYFYQLNFQIGNKTLCWDDTTQNWHDRTHRTSMGAIGRSRALYQSLFNETNYVSDYDNGNVYEYDLDTYTDNGEKIQRLFTLPHLHNNLQFVYFKNLQIDMETGVGLVTGQGDDPQLIMRFSDDGGHTWSNNILGAIGKIGEYTTRLKWNRLGRSRNRVFEFSMTDPVKFFVIEANIDAEVGQ